MTHGRVDSNQQEIVEALRSIGATVQSLADVGSGCPDLLVGLRGRNYLLEVKSDEGCLTPDQKRWHQEWHGDVCVVRCVDDALAALGFVKLNSTFK